MRKKLLLAFIWINTVVCSYAQETRIKNIFPEYKISNKSPLMFMAGDTLLIQCDSVFMVNKARYNFYKNLHAAVLNDNDSICSKLLKVFEIRLVDNEKSFNTLLENSMKAENTYMQTINFSKKTLAETQLTLEKTLMALDDTRKNLQLANEHIRKERWNSAGKKIMVGVGGVAIGLITGILIMR